MSEAAQDLRRKAWQVSLRSQELEEALQSFVNNLRRDGYTVPIDTLASATGIFLDEFARSPDDLSGLKYRLTPLLATNSASQKDISDRIDQFLSSHQQTTEYEKENSGGSARRGAWVMLCFAALVVAIALLGQHVIPSFNAPPAPPTHEVVRGPGLEPSSSSATATYPEIPRDSRAEDMPTFTYVPLAATRSIRAQVFMGAALSIPLVLAFLWWFLRRDFRLRMMRIASHDYDMPRFLARRFGDAEIPISNALGRTASHMNTRTTDEYGGLDIVRTVTETARNAGLFSPVLKESGKDADYVVLVQRLGPNDHMARISDIILDRIEASGVIIRRYYYQHDPRHCLPSPDARQPIPFKDLAKTFGRHRLLVIGASDGFFHPTTGAFLDWTEATRVFLSTAVLTARRPENWSYREEELERRGFFVSTASPSGIATYGAAVGIGQDNTPQRSPPEFYGRDVQGKALSGPGSIDQPPQRSFSSRFRRLWEAGRLRRSDLKLLLQTAPADSLAFAKTALSALTRFAAPAIVLLFIVIVSILGTVWRADLYQAPIASIEESPAATALADLSTFSDCTACPEMVVLPDGVFMMGSPVDEEGRFSDEGPQREVSIRRFAMARTEVTFAQWDACVADGGCTDTPTPGDEGWGRGDRPVINVSWTDAQQYISWLNTKVDQAPYRLPSEAEWEYAARAGTTSPFFFGATISTDQANYNGTFVNGNGETGVYRGRTVPVEELTSANDWGLRHMHGNVLEWVEDCWHGDYSGAPVDGSPWVSSTAETCESRVLRGGSWFNDPQYLRSAVRGRFGPDYRSDLVGFRPARTLLTP